MENPNISIPIAYPTVTIAGAQCQLKLGMGAICRLEAAGIDVRNLRETFLREKEAGRATSLMFKLLAAMAGYDLGDGRWKPLGMTAEEIADAIPETANMKALGETIMSALVKAPPAGTQPAQALPAQTQ